MNHGAAGSCEPLSISARESHSQKGRVTGRQGVAARSCEEMPILSLRTLKYCPLPQVTPICRGQSVPTPPSTFLVSSLARDDSHSHSPETYCKRVRRDERNTQQTTLCWNRLPERSLNILISSSKSSSFSQKIESQLVRKILTNSEK